MYHTNIGLQITRRSYRRVVFGYMYAYVFLYYPSYSVSSTIIVVVRAIRDNDRRLLCIVHLRIPRDTDRSRINSKIL